MGSIAEKRCYYEVLGVVKDASCDDLKKAYRREAMKHHPDRNQGDPEAEKRFKEASEAYQILADEEKRHVYDQFGHAGLEGGGGGFPGGGGGIGDVFSQMQDIFNEMFSGGFGGQRSARGQDVRVQEQLTLREAAFGVKKEVLLRIAARCDTCQGNGAKPGTKLESCGQCRGSGQVSSARGFVMFSTTCPRCRGQGSVIKTPCDDCKGQGAVEKPRKVTVAFPAGIDSGQRLRVTGQGMPGPRGAPSGDLYVDVQVADDPRFERDGADLATRIKVLFSDAALGAEVSVPVLDPENPEATTEIKVPAGTQPGAVLMLKGQGVQRLDGRGRGQLAVVVDVEVPTALTERARQLLTELHAELHASSGQAKKSSAG